MGNPDLFNCQWTAVQRRAGCCPLASGTAARREVTGTQYFVGDFDGETFTSENPKDTILWADFGADFYAAQSWSDEPDGREPHLARLDEQLALCCSIPTTTWRGAFSSAPSTQPGDPPLTACA